MKYRSLLAVFVAYFMVSTATSIAVSAFVSPAASAQSSEKVAECKKQNMIVVGQKVFAPGTYQESYVWTCAPCPAGEAPAENGLSCTKSPTCPQGSELRGGVCIDPVKEKQVAYEQVTSKIPREHLRAIYNNYLDSCNGAYCDGLTYDKFTIDYFTPRIIPCVTDAAIQSDNPIGDIPGQESPHTKFAKCVTGLYGGVNQADLAISMQEQSFNYAAASKAINESSSSSPAAPPSEDGPVAETKTCASEVAGIGWAVCPVIEAASNFADGVWSIFEQLLKTSPLPDDPNNAYYKAWQSIRDISNVILAVIFLIIIFSQVSNIGISNYGIKKLLPRFMIIAVAANLSYFIVQISIDISNMLGFTIGDILTEYAPEIDPSKISFSQLLADMVVIGLTFAAPVGAGLAITGSTIGAPVAILFLLMLLIPAIIGIVAGFMTLIFRSSVLPVLAIVAPIAMIATLLPNTQKVFDKWKNLFLSLLFLFPLAALYYGAIKFFALVILNDNNSGTLQRLMALSLLFIGTFVVIIIAIKSNSMMNGMMRGISGAMNKVTRPVQKFGMGVAGSVAALKFAEFKARDFRQMPNRRLKYDPRKITDKITGATGGATQRGVKWFDNRRTTRERAIKEAGVAASEAYDDMLLENYDPNNKSTIPPEALRIAGGDSDKAKVMLDRMYANRKAENLKKSLSILQTEYAQEKASGKDTDKFLTDRILDSNTSPSDRDAALHMAAQTGRSTVISRVQADTKYSSDTKLRIATEDAIATNASSLATKAPDLVKGSSPAFDNVNGQQLAGFSIDTMKRYMKYVEGQIKNGHTGAARSLLSAVDDISKDVQLQSSFDGAAGRALRDEIVKSTTLSSNIDVAGAAAGIDASSGKIR